MLTGDAAGGIADTIPIEGVHMLLGNDLAGGQVNMYPVLCEKHVICTISVDESELYPECVVTRDMAKKLRECHKVI